MSSVVRTLPQVKLVPGSFLETQYNTSEEEVLVLSVLEECEFPEKLCVSPYSSTDIPPTNFTSFRQTLLLTSSMELIAQILRETRLLVHPLPKDSYPNLLHLFHFSVNKGKLYSFLIM